MTLVLFIHLGGLFNALVYLRQYGYFSPKKPPTRTNHALSHYGDSIFSHSFNDQFSFGRDTSFDSRPRGRLSNAEIVIRIQTSNFIGKDSDSEQSVIGDSGIESAIVNEDEE